MCASMWCSTMAKRVAFGPPKGENTTADMVTVQNDEQRDQWGSMWGSRQ